MSATPSYQVSWRHVGVSLVRGVGRQLNIPMAKETNTSPHLIRTRELRTQWLALNTEADEATESGLIVQARRARRRRDSVANEFCSENKGLAMAVARSFFTQGTRSNHDDYISAGELGLWEAFLKWDPTQSTFGNFSRPYIEGRVRRCVHSMEDEGRSYGDWSAKPVIRAEEARLTDKLGRAPTADEIASAAGVTKDLVDRARMARPVSLDAPVGDGESKLSDLVSAGHDSDDFGDDGFDMGSFAEAIDDPEIINHIEAARLTPIELMVAIRRHGIDGAETQTLTEIAALLGAGTRETVRRHQKRGTAKLFEVALGTSAS